MGDNFNWWTSKNILMFILIQGLIPSGPHTKVVNIDSLIIVREKIYSKGMSFVKFVPIGGFHCFHGTGWIRILNENIPEKCFIYKR